MISDMRSGPSPKSGHLTLGAVCAELRLSARTVSSILNGLEAERGISDATARRVRAYAAEHGYIPDRNAVRTRGAKAAAFGLLINSPLRHSHVLEAFNRFLDRALEYPGGMEPVFRTEGGLERGLAEMAARRLTRFVWLRSISPSWRAEDDRAFHALLPRFSRVVIYNHDFDRSAPDKRWDCPNVVRVGVNREDAFLRLGDELRRLGHRRVAFMSSHRGISDSPFHRAMAARGLETVSPVPEGMDRAYHPELGSMLARAALEARRQEGATVLFGDDYQMAQTQQALLAAGVAVPGDLSVVGFSGNPFTALLTPPLANLAMPVAAMVDKAFAALQAPETMEDQVLPMEWQLRGSLGPAPALVSTDTVAEHNIR